MMLVDVLSLTVISVDYSVVSVRPAGRPHCCVRQISDGLLSEVCNRSAAATLGYRVVR